jgi:hypothetical protein
MDSPTTRRFRGLAVSLVLVLASAAGGLLVSAHPALAALFPQCPPVGADSGCAVLIQFNADGSRVTLFDPSQPPYDLIEDTLVGVQNNSTSSISSLALSGAGIFGFDGDGLCAALTTPKPAGCPYGPTRYEGRGSTTSIASTASGGGNSFVVTNVNSGKVVFSPSIPPGGSAYFSLEGTTSSISVATKVVVNPPAQTLPVGSTVCVTATVTDQTGMPMPGVTVDFSVLGVGTGDTGISGSGVTDTTGTTPPFCYPSQSRLPGTSDVITAQARTSTNTGPIGIGTVVFVLPVSTPGCEIKITGGGWITANNGDKSTFGGNAKIDEFGNLSGEETYQDHGPAISPMDVKSIDILVIVCDPPDFTSAEIFGTATVNGSGTFDFHIGVQDLNKGAMSAPDTYWITLSNGYDSGRHNLEGGNLTIHSSP